MPDYNPDKEGWMKHDWIVCDVDTPGYVETSDGALPFDREGRFRTKDPALAQELKERYPHGEITVSRGVDRSDPHERGHKYIFSVPQMPWKKKEDSAKPAFAPKEASNDTGYSTRTSQAQ